MRSESTRRSRQPRQPRPRQRDLVEELFDELQALETGRWEEWIREGKAWSKMQDGWILRAYPYNGAWSWSVGQVEQGVPAIAGGGERLFLRAASCAERALSGILEAMAGGRRG